MALSEADDGSDSKPRNLKGQMASAGVSGTCAVDNSNVRATSPNMNRHLTADAGGPGNPPRKSHSVDGTVGAEKINESTDEYAVDAATEPA